MSLEQRVRASLKDAGGRIDTAADSTRRPVHAELPREDRRSRPVLAFIAGLVAVLVFGVVAILISGDTSPEIPDEVVPLDPSGVDVLEWFVIDALPEDHVIHEIAEGPNGWLALATSFRNATAGEHLILRSTDGVRWTRLDDVSLPAAVHVDEIIGGEEKYYAFGLFAGDDYQVTTTDQPSGFASPAVWTSEDGATWEVAPLPLPPPEDAISEVVSYRPFHLAEHEGRAVVIGVEFDEDIRDSEGTYIVPTRPIMWESTETGEWHLVDGQNLEEWGDLASGPAGVLAVGGSENETTIMAWADEGWDQMAAMPGNGFEARLVGNEDGYLLQNNTELLFSTDATNWTAVDGPQAGSVIAAHRAGFTIVKRTDDTTHVWWSPDGTDWTIVGTDEELGQDLSFLGAAASENSVMTYGQTQAANMNDVRGLLQVGIDQR